MHTVTELYETATAYFYESPAASPLMLRQVLEIFEERGSDWRRRLARVAALPEDAGALLDAILDQLADPNCSKLLRAMVQGRPEEAEEAARALGGAPEQVEQITVAAACSCPADGPHASACAMAPGPRILRKGTMPPPMVGQLRVAPMQGRSRLMDIFEEYGEAWVTVMAVGAGRQDVYSIAYVAEWPLAEDFVLPEGA